MFDSLFEESTQPLESRVASDAKYGEKSKASKGQEWMKFHIVPGQRGFCHTDYTVRMNCPLLCPLDTAKIPRQTNGAPCTELYWGPQSVESLCCPIFKGPSHPRIIWISKQSNCMPQSIQFLVWISLLLLIYCPWKHLNGRLGWMHSIVAMRCMTNRVKLSRKTLQWLQGAEASKDRAAAAAMDRKKHHRATTLIRMLLLFGGVRSRDVAYRTFVMERERERVANKSKIKHSGARKI